jgi:hypothetical protein
MLMTPSEYFNYLRRTGSPTWVAAYRTTRRGLMRVATGVNSENQIKARDTTAGGGPLSGLAEIHPASRNRLGGLKPDADRQGTRATTTESESGYYQDAGCILYVSEAGVVYDVLGPDAPDLIWKKCAYLSPDAEPTQLHVVDRQAFERCREVLGIDA